MSAPPLPPDVAAYLLQAATSLAEERKFKPRDEADMRVWMERNHREIGERARTAMQDLMSFLLSRPEAMELAGRHIGHAVYTSIPKGEQQWNPTFLEYCAEKGYKPEEAKEKDGNMVPYMCWVANRKKKKC